MAVAVDPVSLGKRYQQQLTQTVDTLKERANTFKQTAEATVTEYKALVEREREQLQPQILAIVDGYKTSIKDLETPVAPNAAQFLLKSYLWTGVCMFVFGVANILGGLFLFPIVGAIFDNWTALLLTYVAFPAFVFLQLRKVQMSEVEREQVVLLASVVEGALVGALFSSKYLTFYGPPIFVLPIIMGLVAHVAGNKEQVAGNRRAFLGALVGGGMFGFVVFGFIFNFNISYIIFMAIVGAAAAADLQLKVASIQRGDSSPQLEQWKTIVILAVAASVARFLISTTKERAADIKEAAAATAAAVSSK